MDKPVRRRVWNWLMSDKVAILLVFAIPIAAIGSIVIRDYMERYRECKPEELLPELKTVLGVGLPAEISGIRTAKTMPIEGNVHFMIKFTAEPNIVDAFLEGLAKGQSELGLKPYDVKWDSRPDRMLSPRWLREPIDQGKSGGTGLGVGSIEVYIDTTDTHSHVVFIDGLYFQTALEQLEERDQ